MIPVQDVWPAVHGTPAKQVMDCRLSLAFEEFQTWAKESTIESAAEIQPGSSVVDLTEIATKAFAARFQRQRPSRPEIWGG